jgi:hypothetical protein
MCTGDSDKRHSSSNLKQTKLTPLEFKMGIFHVFVVYQYIFHILGSAQCCLMTCPFILLHRSREAGLESHTRDHRQYRLL